MQYRSGGPARTGRWRQRLGIPVVGGLVLGTVDIWLLVAIGGRVGALPVLLFVIAEAVIGSWLIRRRWRTVWRTFSDPDRGRIDLQRPEEPIARLLDTGLVVAGGVALIFPGLITALLGLLCLIPFTRRVPAALLGRRIQRRIRGLSDLADPRACERGRRRGYGEVIEGEVVEEPSPGDSDDPDEPVVIRGEVTDH